MRNDPGVTDAHVALAAWYWANSRIPEAESQWQFACEQIDTGCQAYKELIVGTCPYRPQGSNVRGHGRALFLSAGMSS